MLQDREILIIATSCSGAGVLLILITIWMCLRGRRRPIWKSTKYGERNRSDTLEQNVKGLDLRISQTEESRPNFKESFFFQQNSMPANNDVRRSDSNKIPAAQLRVSDRSSRMTEELTSHLVGGYGQVRIKSTYGLPQQLERNSEVRIETVIRESGDLNNRASNANSSTPFLISRQSGDSNFRGSNANSSTPFLNPSYQHDEWTSSHVQQQQQQHERHEDRSQEPLPHQSSRYDPSKLGLVRKQDKEREPRHPSWVTGKESPAVLRKSINAPHVISVQRTSSARVSASRDYVQEAPPRSHSYRVSKMSNELGASIKSPMYNATPAHSVPAYQPYVIGGSLGSQDPRLSGIPMDLGADFDIAYPLAGGTKYMPYYM